MTPVLTREFVVRPETARELGDAVTRRVLCSAPWPLLGVLMLVASVLAALVLASPGAFLVSLPALLALPLLMLHQYRRAARINHPAGSVMVAAYDETSLTVSWQATSMTVPYVKLDGLAVGTRVVTARDADNGSVLAWPRALVPDEAVALIASGTASALPPAPSYLPLVFVPTTRTAWDFAWLAAGMFFRGRWTVVMALTIPVCLLAGLYLVLLAPVMWAIAFVMAWAKLYRVSRRLYPPGTEVRARNDGSVLEVHGPRAAVTLPLGDLTGWRRRYGGRTARNRKDARLVYVFPEQFFPDGASPC